MAANMRPYFMTYNGVSRMVEAPNPAAAVRHVVGAAVTELRPARGAEVASWVREKKPIEVAGQITAPTAREPDGAVSADPNFLPDDCVDWLNYYGAKPADIEVFAQIRSEQRMTLEQFDRLRTACPMFGTAILATVNGETDVPSESVYSIGMDEVRGQLEDNPFPLDVIVGSIADAKRRDNFMSGEDAMVGDTGHLAD